MSEYWVNRLHITYLCMASVALYTKRIWATGLYMVLPICKIKKRAWLTIGRQITRCIY